MDESNVADNKKLWKTVKPLLSEKSVSREKTNLTRNQNKLNSESEKAETFNNLFSNIAKELEIPEFYASDSFTENINDPLLEAILKYKNHPSIFGI